MVGSPYWLYLVNPLPPLNALDEGFAISNKGPDENGTLLLLPNHQKKCRNQT
jgi:hypothetical protein